LPPKKEASRLSASPQRQGQNFVFDFTNVEGHVENFGQAMNDLVVRRADILVAFGNEFALKAAIAASPSLPIVMPAIDFDPTALGSIKSLAPAWRQRHRSFPAARRLSREAGRICRTELCDSRCSTGALL
jgi:hypothetical protein